MPKRPTPTLRDPRTRTRAISYYSLVLGIAGVAVSFAAFLADSDEFLVAWLISWFYFFSIAVGCLGFLMIFRLTGGRWGASLEWIMYAASTTWEVLFLLFLPLFWPLFGPRLGGTGTLYRWARTAGAGVEETLRHKQAYLNIPFWCLRSLFYFLVWLFLARALTRADAPAARRLSAGGLIAVFLTVSFASIDWLMSLEPLWYSTVYGMMILCGQGIVGLAFPLLLLHELRNAPGWKPPLTDEVLMDHGNLLLTTCILWTYIAFVQWLIVWIGNVPETTTWYVSRATRSWQAVAWLIVIGQFAIPFQLLLFRVFKTRAGNLAGLGLFLLLIHFVEIYWLVVPAFHPDAFVFNWRILPAFAAVGGLWSSFFFRRLRTLDPRSVESEYARRLKEILSHG